MNWDEKFLTCIQLAEKLNVKMDWIYQKVHKGIIPYYKIGGLLRFKMSEIDEWLEKFSNKPKYH